METSTTLQTQVDSFFFSGCEVEFEDLTNYKQFGLHPVILGDVLPKPLTCVSDVNKEPRYRIMLKLGYGAFATVWLARDLVEERYVAVKVGLGSDKPLPDREAEILSHICKTGPGKHGYERVIELLDVFIVEGPNGFHQCLVTEVVAPLSDEDTNHYCSFDAVRQIVEGFAFLHGEGIIHGDPHIGNFGIALPQLDQFEEADIIDYFVTSDAIAVIPRDPKFPMNSIPPYIVPSAVMTYFLESRKAFPAGSLIVKILDFGRAYRISKATPNLLGAAPKMILPPEYLLRVLCDGRICSTWSEAADIWAVGCTLYHVKCGVELISTRGSLKDFLFDAIQFGGPPPETWPKLWITHDRQHENFLQNRDSVWKVPRNEERLKFLKFIQRMIITNPDERTTTAALLTDPFMVASATI
ncbi:hypothetical protein E4U50_007597 [Claviceps purpurea]|nr:hypothetical protein E4U37_002810 [Claviceps purpurea]KAG6164531.1 hypothetical protein E4U11_001112 [Claviceps purpurea]KAG6215354.1 hypothetical protein E4U50_007597 [Claviceps purpurea]